MSALQENKYLTFLRDNALIIAVITALVALTPPPLPLFPPQGLPQPSVIGAGGINRRSNSVIRGVGGGVIPASAIEVGKMVQRFRFYLYISILELVLLSIEYQSV
jgi:hypothetical protein